MKAFLYALALLAIQITQASQSEEPLENGEIKVPISINLINMTEFQVYNGSQQTLKVPEIPFIAHRKEDPGQGYDANLLIYESERNIAVYTHGYATYDLIDGQEIKDALFKGADDIDVVILVDWRLWSLPKPTSWPGVPGNYKLVALTNLPIVAERLKTCITSKMRNEYNDLYLIGFSLGGHISGTAARNQNIVNVKRITGIKLANTNRNKGQI